MVANAEKPALLFMSANDWEMWLKANPEHPGVRLQIRKKRSSASGITYDEAL